MKKELKGFICGAVTTSVLLCGGAFAAGKWTTIDVLQDDITVIVDGKQVTESNFVYNDRTYLPLRAVAEAVNKPVEYDEATNTAYIGSKPNNIIPESNITYYAEAPWAPDFGAFTGAEYLNMEKMNDGLNDIGALYCYVYVYISNDINASSSIESYIQQIEELGFVLNRKDESDGSVLYSKDKYHISIMESDGNIGVAVLEDEIFNIDYEKESIFIDVGANYTNIFNFNITDIKKRDSGKELRIECEVTGKWTQNTCGYDVICYDADGYLIDNSYHILSTGYSQFKLKETYYVPIETVKIVFLQHL